MSIWMTINLLLGESTHSPMQEETIKDIRKAWRLKSSHWRLIVDLPDLVVAGWIGGHVYKQGPLNVFIAWKEVP